MRRTSVTGIGCLLCTTGLLLQGEGGQPATQQIEQRITLRMILLDSRERAEEVRERLTKGEDFAGLARSVSRDPSAARGGLIGTVKPEELRPELRATVEGLHPGQISEIVVIGRQYAILLAEGIQERNARSEPTPGLPYGRAAGPIRYTREVSGVALLQESFRNMPKPPDWDQDLQLPCRLHQAVLEATIRSLGTYLNRPELQSPTPGNLYKRMSSLQMLAQLWSYQANMAKAREYYQDAVRVAASIGEEDLELEMEEELGLTQLYRAHLEHSVMRMPASGCLFPSLRRIEGGGDLIDEARAHFLRYLQERPDDLEVQWLLNLAYMGLGQYPDGVPGDYRIPPSLFGSEDAFPRLTDVAASSGFETLAMAGGAIVDDLDGDGNFDIVTSAMDPCAPLSCFENEGDGTFRNRATEAGLAGQLGGLNAIQADYDNDGDVDILVLRGGWQFPVRNSLLRNRGDGTFTDVTAASGLAEPAARTQTAAWADIDNDGDLDLFVGNELVPSQLFLNQGDGTFVDIGESAGVARVAYTKAVVAGDYDNDGYPDFYVSNFRGDNFLYHNNQDRTFSEVAKQAGVLAPWESFPAWFFDYDNDGWLDVMAFSFYTSVDETIRSYLGRDLNGETLKLYRNTGRGVFEDVTGKVGLARSFMPMGANFGDIDNDGFLDFYLGTGNPSLASLVPNVLMKNQGGRSFVDVTRQSGTGCLHKGHGVAFADLDHDGDQELIAEVGGMVPTDRHASLLFENPGNGHHWLGIRLVGVRSNRLGVGVRIRLSAAGPNGRREIHRMVGSGGSFGASPMEQQIGLGDDDRIARLEIWWPTSGLRQVFRDVRPDQFIQIVESEPRYEVLHRRPFRLGRAAKGRP